MSSIAWSSREWRPPGSNARKFGEIVAAGVLAGELSLLGALAAQHLAWLTAPWEMI